MNKGEKQMNNMYKNRKLHKCKVQEVNVNSQWLVLKLVCHKANLTLC